MKRVKAYITPTAFVAFFVLCGFLSFQVGVATEHQAKQHANTKAVENPFYIFWQWTTHDPVAFYTSVLALFTFVLSASTLGLWWVTWRSGIRQASDMEKAVGASITSNQISVYNAERQLRAYVFVQDINLELLRRPPAPGTYGGTVPGPVHTYKISIIWENSGQTPPRNMFVNFNCRSFVDQMPDDFCFADTEAPKREVIGPRTTVTHPGIDLPIVEIEHIADEKVRWYIWAWAEYDDIFSGTARHRTEFCCEIKANRNRTTGEIGVHFPLYGKFNGADNECLRPFNSHENRYG